MSSYLVQWFPEHHTLQTITPMQQWTHISLAILTFSVICLAALQAILLHMQDRLLRHYQHGHSIINKLPAVEVMERWLFHTITLGLILLTITFITSAYFFTNLFEPPLLKKTIL